MAKLYFRYGAMNCGKTTSLLQVAYNYKEIGMDVLLLKPSVDKKGGKSVVSRLGSSREVDYLVTPDESIAELVHDNLKKSKKKVSCILVDEAQFLQPKQVDDLFNLSALKNIHVICYGLRTDCKGNGFPGSSRLLELASSIEEMKTICECGKKATMNARFVNGKFTVDGDQVAIDGFDEVTYKSMCPKCYLKKVKELVKNKND